MTKIEVTRHVIGMSREYQNLLGHDMAINRMNSHISNQCSLHQTSNLYASVHHCRNQTMTTQQLIGLTGGEVVREILCNHGTRHVCMLDLLFLTEFMS